MLLPACDEVEEEKRKETCEDMPPIVIDLSNHFRTEEIFTSLREAQYWIKDRGIEVGVVIKIFKSDISPKRNPYVKYGCERSGDQSSHSKGGITKKKVGGKDKSKPRNTFTSKCNCPFRILCKGNKHTGLCFFKVLNGKHNHPLIKYEYGHTLLERLTEEEKDNVRRLAKNNVRPKNILLEIKEKNPKNFSLPKMIYNTIEKAKRDEMAGRSIIQEVFNLAEKDNYFIRHTRSDGRIENLFWSHRESIDMAKSFPYVFMMDCTYKTNRYKMPLLQIIGVTCTSQSFSAGFALLGSERESNYIWALQMFRESLEISLPTCIVTDKEVALLNAIGNVFPDTKHLLCRWHIGKAIEAHCRSKYKAKERKDIKEKWYEVQNSETEDEYHKNWEKLRCILKPESVKYMEDIWLTKFKHMFVAAWTEEYFHLGITSTSRVEGVHAVLKKWLGTSNVSLVTHWNSVRAMIEAQIRDIHGSFETSVSKTPKEWFGKDWCRQLFGSVSYKALQLLKEEFDQVSYAVIEATGCNCTIRTTHGLPCVHEIKLLLAKNNSIPLSTVHIYWRTLSNNGPGYSNNQELDCRPLINQFIQKFEKSPNDGKFELLERLREVVEPSTTVLKEPLIKINVKGRPKGSRNKCKSKENEDECSTKRDPSLFEHVNLAMSQMEAQQSELEVNQSQTVSKEKVKKRPVKKQKVNHAKEKSPKPVNGKSPWYLSFFSPQMQDYVYDVVDVESDGNCGFRAVAVAIGWSEKQWPRVRMDLWNHLIKNRDHYMSILRKEKTIDKLIGSLYWTTGGCTQYKWMDSPTALWLICDVYNVGVSCLSTLMNLTIFPSINGPPSEGINHIWIAHVNRNHYIVPKMTSNCPMPVVSSPWHQCCTEEAKKWELLFKDRLDEGERLFFPQGRPMMTASCALPIE